MWIADFGGLVSPVFIQVSGQMDRSCEIGSKRKMGWSCKGARSSKVGAILHGAIVEEVLDNEPVSGDASVKRDTLPAGGLRATRTIGPVQTR